jgi:tetrapyrrole methylase family protein / MazG family protein
LGDVLFTLVNVARWHKIDAELALRDTVKRFSARFEHMEKAAQQNNRVLEDLSPPEWDDLWNSAKRESDNV